MTGPVGPLPKEPSVSGPSHAILEQLGSYSIIAELARGGMARVYLARRRGEAGFERLFAVKVMHEHMADDPEAVLMLLDEAHIASQLHHPNVVPILDIGTYDGGYYLVMDYVEGCSFDQLLGRNRRRRPPRVIVPILLDALRGLHAAHELVDGDGSPTNLVHRDVSPQNLLVGVDGTCRVTDFGIAKASARFTHTRDGVHKGKLSYMSPEQLHTPREIDRRTDVWAVGVIMFYALTGRHPFRGESQAMTVHQVLYRALPPASSAGLRPPACFDAICARAINRDVGERYPTAEAMAEELRRVAMRNDLLGSPSEVAAWVTDSFGDIIAARRESIRGIKGKDDSARSSIPVLPRIAITPSTGGVESPLRDEGAADREGSDPTEEDDVPTRADYGTVDVPVRGAGARRPGWTIALTLAVLGLTATIVVVALLALNRPEQPGGGDGRVTESDAATAGRAGAPPDGRGDAPPQARDAQPAARAAASGDAAFADTTAGLSTDSEAGGEATVTKRRPRHPPPGTDREAGPAPPAAGPPDAGTKTGPFPPVMDPNPYLRRE